MDNTEEIIPRFEFRAFARQFGHVVDAIRRRSACAGIKESWDIYLVAPSNETNNVKIRDNQLDIKSLMKVEHGLEQWRPLMKLDFPAPAHVVQEEIFPALQVNTPFLADGDLAMDSFLRDVIWPHKEVFVAHVFKRRFFFAIHECRTEITELIVNGAAIQTIAIEDEDAQKVLIAQERIGLAGFENVNYLLALQRIMGLSPLPEPQWKIGEG